MNSPNDLLTFLLVASALAGAVAYRRVVRGEPLTATDAEPLVAAVPGD